MEYQPSAILVCPTLNPGHDFAKWVEALKIQDLNLDKVLIIDSGSNDQTVHLALHEGLDVLEINKTEFNHGATRQRAVEENNSYDVVIFLTQDAILTDAGAIRKIVDRFRNEKVAAVCGRQLPRPRAGKIESHARLFNYPEASFFRTFSDKNKYGVKAAFLSNSFSAYRVSALNEIGGFPCNVIFGEDMYVAARLLKAGYEIAYAADACVWHSHDYTISQEFKRYFDLGVFHAREPWIIKEFGKAEGEGFRFVSSELRYLLKHAFWRIPEAIFRTALKYTAYRLGLMEARMPLSVKKHLSMSPSYFNSSYNTYN
jgi:rhamnosyltransferase